MSSPLAQFEIKPLLPFSINGTDLSFTNSSLFMLLTVLSIMLFFGLTLRRISATPGRWQMLAEIVHDAIANLVSSTAGEKARPYFPFIFSVFLFILFGNFLGMVPLGFTITSHISVTLALALAVFITVTITGFVKHGAHFLHFFVPQGAPWWLVWLLVPIELFSYLVRPLSLAIRLSANMLAGHILIKVFAGMVASLVAYGAFGWLVAPMPLAVTIFLVGFEFFVALIQAYIFAILSAVYLRDALEMH